MQEVLVSDLDTCLKTSLIRKLDVRSLDGIVALVF